MRTFAKVAFGALMLGAASIAGAAPAAAHTSVGISFGFGDRGYEDPCAYYDYYDVPPPWGLPPGYCGYRVYYDPVFWGGSWYRGPIYYRWYGGHRQFWLHGGWRRDEWRGHRPARIEWRGGDGDWRGSHWHGADRWDGGDARWRSGGHWGRGGAGRRDHGDRFRGDDGHGDHHRDHWR